MKDNTEFTAWQKHAINCDMQRIFKNRTVFAISYVKLMNAFLNYENDTCNQRFYSKIALDLIENKKVSYTDLVRFIEIHTYIKTYIL